LTRTGKVRRRIVQEKYQGLIDALYSNQQHADIVSEVTFEDGAKGSVSADLKISDLSRVERQAEPLAKAS
jgi:long-chain acyl-CoA synthetase